MYIDITKEWGIQAQFIWMVRNMKIKEAAKDKIIREFRRTIARLNDLDNIKKQPVEPQSVGA